MTQSSSEDLHQWHDGVSKSIRLPVIVGGVVFVLGICGFGAWAGMAPIDSAVIASGKFIATGQNKIIQHLEGGIVDEILVKEGDSVTRGQPLVRLDDTATKAQLRRLELRRYRFLAMQSRLIAERHGYDKIALPEALGKEPPDPEVAAMVERQRTEFDARRDELKSETEILQRRIAAIREEITGIGAQRHASSTQLTMINQEIVGQEKLFEKGLARLTSLLALRRSKAKLEGERGELIAKIARSKERITETESQIVHLRSKQVEEVVAELRKVETDLDDVEEQIKAARDVLDRLQVKAPVRGIVVKLAHHTRGGIVGPGQEILELLPVEEKLLVEAFIRPIDIDVVQKDDIAELRMTALDQRTTPTIPGRVSYVSADTVEGKRPEEIFYISRIVIDETEAEKIADFNPAPGMPVEVYIKTGEQTFLEYLARPILDSLSRAFREN